MRDTAADRVPTGPIVVGVDGTDSGRAALEGVVRAIREDDCADWDVPCGVRILAVHVRPQPSSLMLLVPAAVPAVAEWREELELHAWIDCAETLTRADIGWDFVVRDGRPADVLRHVAEKVDARAVVLGSRPRRRFAALWHHCPVRALKAACPAPVRTFPVSGGFALGSRGT